ncbi:hypothetical protein FWD20_00955 [Candidatus Saccharibacteria bacterium]|nr:hypothetical protein [Candidatus Saccharibacteria bacterium]
MIEVRRATRTTEQGTLFAEHVLERGGVEYQIDITALISLKEKVGSEAKSYIDDLVEILRCVREERSMMFADEDEYFLKIIFFETIGAVKDRHDQSAILNFFRSYMSSDDEPPDAPGRLVPHVVTSNRDPNKRSTTKHPAAQTALQLAGAGGLPMRRKPPKGDRALAYKD